LSSSTARVKPSSMRWCPPWTAKRSPGAISGPTGSRCDRHCDCSITTFCYFALRPWC
jgi:hypothetical protein